MGRSPITTLGRSRCARSSDTNPSSIILKNCASTTSSLDAPERAADILAVGLEPGLYMIATSEEAFETLGAQFRDRHREERARLDFMALQLKEGGDYHAFFTDFMHLAKRARITEDRFKQEFAMKLPRVLGIQVAGLERSNAITFTEYHEKVSEIAYYLEREKKLVEPTPAPPRLEKKAFLSNNWRNRENHSRQKGCSTSSRAETPSIRNSRPVCAYGHALPQLQQGWLLRP